MTLYLKYRPQTIEDLDLDNVRTTLKNIISTGNLPHAFLFAGPKGAGKTSAARILAKVVNCEKNGDNLGEPCNECAHCISISKGQNMDVLELDAASHRRIDDIRALKENIALAPNSARKKVYIIDEAHMLTKEAANAFLKTLEEPPGHVLFILATTDPQMLPPTILSRLTTVQFSKATEAEVSRQLKKVIKGEGLEVEEEVIGMLAHHCDGSFRDAAKLLEALASQSKKITVEIAQNILESGKFTNPKELLSLLSEGKKKECLELVSRMSKEGLNIRFFVDSLIFTVREALLAECQLPGHEKLNGFAKDQLISLANKLLEARSRIGMSPIEELPLQLVIADWQENIAPKSSHNTAPSKPIVTAQKVEEKTETVVPKSFEGQVDGDVWTKVLMAVRGKNTTVDALLRAARPLNFDGKVLEVGVYYRFHKERLEVSQNRRALEDIVEEVTGSPIRVSFALAERPDEAPAKLDPPLTKAKDDDIIQAAKEIFGT